MRFKTKHLSEELLINFAEGLLENKESEQVKKHLEKCGNCSAEASSFAKILHLLKTDRAEDAPAELINWSKNIFRSRISEPKKSVLQKIAAILEMDLSKNQPAFGERSSALPTRQMLFRADEIGITLKISNDEGKISLMGQILDEKFGGCETILSNEKKSFFSKANELSEFKIQDVPDGIYILTVRNSEKEISVENLELS